MPEARVIPLSKEARAEGASGEARRATRRRAGSGSDVSASTFGGRPGGARGSSAAAGRAGVRGTTRNPGAAPRGRRVRDLAPAGGEPADWERQLAGALAFLRRRITGEYEVDDFGFDADLTDHILAPVWRPLYQRWFRVETRGLDNIPDTGHALVVANHSGAVPLDSVMAAVAIHDHHPAHRHLRMLGADFAFSAPFLAPLARKAGHTLACNADAERLLSNGELVGVWPEGFKGIGKPFSERYKLQRFGRGGFVSAALRTGAPIIPCSIVGAEEIYPIVGNLRTLARIVGLPYLPITPFFPLLGPLGLIPLPSKWIIEFGDPVETASLGPAAAEDPMLVFNLTDQIRETIQQTLYQLLMQRRSVFF
ncbi:MAG: lysophospholipid acyltransferase family protein [Frankiaceae bacterium]